MFVEKVDFVFENKDFPGTNKLGGKLVEAIVRNPFLQKGQLRSDSEREYMHLVCYSIFGSFLSIDTVDFTRLSVFGTQN